MAAKLKVAVFICFLFLVFGEAANAAYVEGTCQQVRLYKDQMPPESGGPNALVFECMSDSSTSAVAPVALGTGKAQLQALEVQMAAAPDTPTSVAVVPMSAWDNAIHEGTGTLSASDYVGMEPPAGFAGGAYLALTVAGAGKKFILIVYYF